MQETIMETARDISPSGADANINSRGDCGREQDKER